jgi:LPXTG-site transpeptidase (sortase) family protein
LTPVQPRLHNTAATVRLPAPAPVAHITTGRPVSIQVANVGIDLKITDGSYDSAHDSWTLTDDKAQFATMTDLPNDRAGQTFIYGHNTDAVFAKLSGLKAGDTATIRTANGHMFTYVYTGEQIVQPSNTQILNDEPATPRLTLMTCEGIFSQTRRIMYFDFKEVI